MITIIAIICIYLLICFVFATKSAVHEGKLLGTYGKSLNHFIETGNVGPDAWDLEDDVMKDLLKVMDSGNTNYFGGYVQSIEKIWLDVVKDRIRVMARNGESLTHENKEMLCLINPWYKLQNMVAGNALKYSSYNNVVRNVFNDTEDYHNRCLDIIKQVASIMKVYEV